MLLSRSDGRTDPGVVMVRTKEVASKIFVSEQGSRQTRKTSMIIYCDYVCRKEENGIDAGEGDQEDARQEIALHSR